MEPRPEVFPAGASPPDTAFSFFGCEGNIPAVPSSTAGTVLSELAFEASTVEGPECSGTLVCTVEVAALSWSDLVVGLEEFPLVFVWSAVCPFVVALGSSTFSATTSSPAPSI